MATTRRALAVRGALTHELSIAGRRLRASFAGDALEQSFWPALRHRHTPPPLAASTELELLAWDSASTGIEPPPAPWEGIGFATWSRERAHQRNEIEIQLCGMGSFSLLDRRQGIGSYWVRSEASVPPWDRPAPFRSLLAMWAAQVDAGLLHAAAIGDLRGALLLTARGGSGKSTTAVSALLRGMLFLGEDYVLVQSSKQPGERPHVHNLYGTAKLDERSMSMLFGADTARPARQGTGPDYDKHVIYLEQTHAQQLTAALPLRAIVVPTIGKRGQTQLSPLGAAAVLRALAPSTLLQLPGSGAHSLALLASIAAAAPGYALELGPNHDENVAALRGLLTDLHDT